MIPVPAGVRVWLATGHSDMRKGFPGLGIADAGEAQDRSALRSSVRLSRAPRWACQGDWHDGQGACLFSKRLERGRFIGPRRPTAP